MGDHTKIVVDADAKTLGNPRTIPSIFYGATYKLYWQEKLPYPVLKLVLPSHIRYYKPCPGRLVLQLHVPAVEISKSLHVYG